MTLPVTVVIPVKNEAENLPECLSRLEAFARVVVVDSGSTDATCSIASEAGAKVLQFDWDGKFPKKRNWVLRNHSFKTDWVLFLDADEFVTPEFVSELEGELPTSDKQGYWLNFENHFMGRKLRGGDAFRKLALFRPSAGEYERIAEDRWSHLDMEVHEHPVLKAAVGEIEARIQHNDLRGLGHYIAKHNEYSSWEAHRYLRLRGENGPEWEGLTERQKKKYRNLSRLWFAPAYFFASFFLKRGFRDGATGFHFALMKAIYFYQVRLKIAELRKARNDDEVDRGP